MTTSPNLPNSLLALQSAPSLTAVLMEMDRRKMEKARRELEENLETIRLRCRRLSSFVREAWPVLEPSASYVHNWHVDAICEHLEAVSEGRINRLLINVPPGSMKSLLVSVLWPAWEWAMGHTSLRYLTTSHNDKPVIRDTRKMRDLVLSRWYQSLFPHVVLNRTGETSFSNTRTGTREGVAFGSLTSQRGDRLLIDDPHSTDTAESEKERERDTLRFREGALNRLNDQDRSAIVVIMQRLHEFDISGIIISMRMPYVKLILPAEFEPERRCSTEIGFVDPRSTDGELLDPGRFPRAVVDQMKKDTTAYAWAGQYQQRPAPREGGMFKRHWFEFVQALPARRVSCRGWDLAATKTQTAAATAGVLLSYAAGVYYVEHCVAERESPAGVKRLIKSIALMDGAVRISIPQDPGQASKGQVLEFGSMLDGHDVRFSTEREGDKVQRASPMSAQAEIGNVKIYRTGDAVKDAWIEPFLEELCSFPAGFKDRVDAMSRAYLELLTMSAYDDDDDIGGMIQVAAGQREDAYVD